MTDQIQSPQPEQPEVGALDIVTQQQNAIRGFVESRVGTEPVTGTRSDALAKEFGLEEGQYDVYTDKEPPFGGGFIKFVPKDNTSEALMGFTQPNIGGPYNNPNRRLDHQLLQPNGDIVGRGSVENNEGVNSYDIFSSSDTQDPEVLKRHQRLVQIMHDHAQELVTPRAERTQGMVTPELGQPAREGRVRKMLGRFSLR